MTAPLDLFGMHDHPTEDDLQALRKRDLRNLLTSYADEADVVVEVIQNAYDALVAAIDAGLYQGDQHPELTIVIGRRLGGDPHYVLVVDNGVGMSPEVAKRFTTPGFSAGKALGRSVGYKGVGASFFFAAANKISFQTKSAGGATSSATATGAHSWIMSTHEPAPVITADFTCPDAVRDAVPQGRGTAVYYELHPGTKPKSLSHLVASNDDPQLELRAWACLLASKTALGQVADISARGIKVALWLDTGSEVAKSSWTLGAFNLDTKTLGYPYPWSILRVHKDITEIDSTPEAQRVWAHSGKHQALRLHWDRRAILGLTPAIDFSDDERALVESNLDFIDFFFGYSTDVLQAVHDRTGTRGRVIRYGIRLAVDGIPQGRMLDIDLTSNQGLGRQAHAVFAFKQLELDTGRKIPANELATEVIRKVGVRAMSVLANYRWAMRTKERPDPSVDLEGWRNSVRERMSSSLVKHLFDKLGIAAPLFVDPETENDVIALYSVLLAQNTLLGYQLVALSGFNRYDGLVHIDASSATVRSTTDPLSVRDTSVDRSGQYKVLEFKLQFQSLLEDFESRAKRPQDIDLAVCWTLPEPTVQRGHLQYTYGDRNDYRQVYGLTHLWSDENRTSSVPILCLKHFVTEKLKLLEVGSPSLGTARFNDLLIADRNASI